MNCEFVETFLQPPWPHSTRGPLAKQPYFLYSIYYFPHFDFLRVAKRVNWKVLGRAHSSRRMARFIILKVARGSLLLSGGDPDVLRLAVNLVNGASYQYQGGIEKLVIEPSSDCPEVFDVLFNPSLHSTFIYFILIE